MRSRYCGTLALEYKHLLRRDEADWLERRFEARAPLGADERRAALRRLLEADALERFLGRKFPASKRFGLEGCEALLPGLRALAEAAAGHGVQDIKIGMAHR